MAGRMRMRLRLLLVCMALTASALLTVVSASRFSFTLTSRAEECFLEEVDARSSNSKLLFRFGLVEPKYYDLMDVEIRTPRGRVVESWNRTQAGHVTSPVRESGLYHFCFRKRSGASRVMNVYYSYEFISTGSPHAMLYANVAATLDKTAPNAMLYKSMAFKGDGDELAQVGILDFSLSGISKSVLHRSTRVQLVVSVENLSVPNATVSVAMYPDPIQFPVTWRSVGEEIVERLNHRVFGVAAAELGGHLVYDVTSIFEAALRAEKSSVSFTLHTEAGVELTLTGISNSYPAYYPQLVIEDMGLDLMHAVAFFKQRVFELRGEITHIRQKERHSRNAAESTNGRVQWLSLVTNVVLVGIAGSQVLYIRSLLDSSY